MAKIFSNKYTKDKVKEEVNALIDMHDVCRYEVTKIVAPQKLIVIRVTIDLPYAEPNEKIIV